MGRPTRDEHLALNEAAYVQVNEREEREMDIDQMSAELGTTEEGVIALWIAEYLAADCADAHTNFVHVGSASNFFAEEAFFEVDVCDPDATYRIRVEKVHKL